MGLFDKVITSTTTTKSGMIVEKSYTDISKEGERHIFKDRKVFSLKDIICEKLMDLTV